MRKTNKLSKGLLMSALICGSAFLGGTEAFTAELASDEELKAFTLDPLVITAQRRETKDLDTPASVSVITSADIERSGAKTAYSIIERQVGLTNNAYGPDGREFGGSSSRTVLRGLDKGTLVMVNGAPINMLNYNNMNGIPAQAIEKIEIVRGAQSALYGAEAFGGVVNIITKKGGPSKTTVSYGAGNYDQKWAVTTSGDKYNVYLSKDYYGDVHDTNKVFAKSTRKWKYRDSTKENVFVNIAPTDRLSFQYAHTKGKYYRDSWTVKNSVLTGAGTAYLYEDIRDNVSALYDDKENQFKTVLSYNQREVDPYKSSINKFGYEPMKEADSSNWKMHTMTWDTQKGWNFRNGQDALVVGMAFQKEKMKDRGAKKDADRTNAALYASYKYQFSPDFSATFGVRGQHINDYVKDQNVLLPQIQTLYKLSDDTSWYVNVGKSYQMPALNQYFTEGRTEQLKPQEGWTYETGIKIINEASSWKFDVFHMDIDGKFEWIDVGRPDGQKVLINAGKFKNTGAEVEYTQNINDNLQFRLGAMYANPKTRGKDKKGNDLGYYEQSDARLQFIAGLDYQLGKLATNLNYLYLGKREASYYDSLGQSGAKKENERTTPHRSLLNANFTYTADRHNSVVLTLNNILDTKDTINKYENWGMPFNWMLTYNYTF